MMNETSSVYQLVTRLCSSLIKDADDNDEKLPLKSAKCVAFKELLKYNCTDVDPENISKELEFAAFELMLAERSKDAKQINEFTELISKEKGNYGNISWMILQLKNIDPDGGKQQVREMK